MMMMTPPPPNPYSHFKQTYPCYKWAKRKAFKAFGGPSFRFQKATGSKPAKEECTTSHRRLLICKIKLCTTILINIPHTPPKWRCEDKTTTTTSTTTTATTSAQTSFGTEDEQLIEFFRSLFLLPASDTGCCFYFELSCCGLNAWSQMLLKWLSFFGKEKIKP